MQTDRQIIRLQYFFYFGTMGVYLPYFNLYCLDIGLSGFEIGSLSAVRSAVLVLFSILWSVLADRKGLRRPIYILCSVISTALWAPLLFITDFEAMVVVIIAYGMFFAPLIAFIEAFAMEVLAGSKKSYGRTRVWGSIAFIAVVVVVGHWIDRYGVRWIVSLVLMLSMVHALAALLVPKTTSTRSYLTQKAARLFTAHTMVFLFCAFLMLVSHGAYYGFFSIHLTELGIEGSFVGLCWALASASEVIVMLYSARLFSRFSLQQVLAVTFAAATIRWGVLLMVHSPLAILFSQLLHAITYGAFHMAGILYMDQLSPVSDKTLGQAVNNAVTYGLGLTAGFFISGALYKKGESAELFLFSACVSLAGGLLFVGYHWWHAKGSSGAG